MAGLYLSRETCVANIKMWQNVSVRSARTERDAQISFSVIDIHFTSDGVEEEIWLLKNYALFRCLIFSSISGARENPFVK